MKSSAAFGRSAWMDAFSEMIHAVLPL